MAQQVAISQPLQTGNLVLDLEKTTLTKDKTVFHLTPKESKLMAVLMKNVGQIVRRAACKGMALERNR